MRFGVPEILVAGSVVLLSTGSTTTGWVFLGLGILGSAIRWGVEIQNAQLAKQEAQQNVDETAKVISEVSQAVSSIFETFNTSEKSSRSQNNDSKFH